MMKKRITQNIINLIVFIVCITIIISGSIVMQNINSIKSDIINNLELEWRQQSKRILFNIENQFMYDLRHNVVDPDDELSLQEWAKRNISGILNGGETGDAFMINLADEKFIWDGSLDCVKPEFITNGRYMSDESKMHVDKEQAEKIINKMRLGNSTLNNYEKNWWNFDGSIEYLEWIVIPPGHLGFYDESKTIGGAKNSNYSKILIALGTQKDEIEYTYKGTFKKLNNTIKCVQTFIVLSVIVCIFNMIIYVYMNKKI